MKTGHHPDRRSPTASGWFALRRRHRERPMLGWFVSLGLVLVSDVLVYALGQNSPAPFLPFYPAIIIATLLGGRPTGYLALFAAELSIAQFLEQRNMVLGDSPATLTLILSLVVGMLVVEILSHLGKLAEMLGAREVELTAALGELEAIYDEAPIGLGLLDRNFRFVRINAALADMNGFSIEDHLGRSVWDLVPDLKESAEPVLRRVLETNTAVKGVELSGETAARPGARRDWWEMFYPVHDSHGAVQGIGIFCEDVTEANQARERERLLTREVDHRAKNLLTVIQSVIKLTRSTGSVDEFKAAVSGRIQALGRVHTLLSINRWEGVHLDELVRRELEPFGAAAQIGEIPRPVLLQPGAAQAISMILHELATNSAKHGSLSCGGQVEFVCSAPDENTGDVSLTWREHGGKPVSPATGSGFGTTLIRTAVKGLLSGELVHELRPEGLFCQIRFRSLPNAPTP